MPRGGNCNQYGASPWPRSTLGYAASTANDISLAAFGHLESVVAGWPVGAPLTAEAYRDRLEAMRARIRTAWDLDPTVDVVFAPSGTDLEFVALALASTRAGQPVDNILLGQDEVGSGCALAAAGRFFAGETAVASTVERGSALAGLAATRLFALPIRDAGGRPVASGVIAAGISDHVEAARANGRHVLAHVVHGSKTGLVLPNLPDLDALMARHGEHLTVMVDACQARIDGADIGQYLSRGAIVLLTGSKFIGGPPFSGIALVPPALRPRAPLAVGLEQVFRRGEWPLDWTGCDGLPNAANPGLLLRLEAALFELERFCHINGLARQRVIEAFGGAVSSLSDRLGAALVAPMPADGALHETTLATLDLSSLPGNPDLETTRRWGRILAARGLRVGQPVQWRRMADGRWGGNLRISLSMPLIGELAGLDMAVLRHRLDADMGKVADVLEAAQRPVVA